MIARGFRQSFIQPWGVPFADTGIVEPLLIRGQLVVPATVARNSLAWDWNSQGILQQYAINTPVIGYNPATGALRGLQVEKAWVNLVLGSTDFANTSYWTKSDSAVTGQPDLFGGDTAVLRTENSSDSAIFSQSTYSVSNGSTYTDYWIVKRGNLPQWIRIVSSSSNDTSNYIRAWFDLLNGVVGSITSNGWTTTGSSSRIQSLGDDRWLLSLTHTVGSTAKRNFIMSAASDASTDRANIGSGAGIGITYTLYQAQTVLGTDGAPLIITGASAVTREADNISIEDYVREFLNANTDVTFFFEAAVPPSGVDAFGFAMEGTSVVGMGLRRATNNVIQFFRRGSANADISTAGTYTSGNLKICLAYTNGGTASMTVNGVTVDSATSVSYTFTNNFQIGAYHTSATQFWQNHIKNLVMYPARLSQAQREAMTT